MTVESASFISQLVATNPGSSDPKSEGDDHLRLTKTVLQTQFPNLGAAAVTPTAAQLNQLASNTLTTLATTESASIGGSLQVTGTNMVSSATTAVSTGLAGGFPELAMTYSSGGTDSKIWDQYADATTYHGRVVNDAGTGSQDWLQVVRAAAAITSVTFPQGKVQATGGGVSSGLRIGSAAVLSAFYDDGSGNVYIDASLGSNTNIPVVIRSKGTGTVQIPNGGLSVTGPMSATGAVTASSITFGGSTLSTFVEQTAFTPAVTGIGSPTYTTQTGTYQRIGNKIKFICSVVYTGGTNAAAITGITGLPTSGIASIQALSLMLNVLNGSFSWTGTPIAYMNGSATIQIGIQNTAVNSASLLNPSAGTKELYIAGEYFV